MTKLPLILLCCAPFLLFEETKAYSYDKKPSIDELKLNSKTFTPSPRTQTNSSDAAVPINAPVATDVQTMDGILSYEEGKTKISIKLDRYNEKTYALAYDVFVMNGQVGLAFVLAQAAVKHNPQQVGWREKLAQAALWSGNAEVALNQWLYFINNNITPDKYVQPALTLAKQLNNFDVQATLLQYQLNKNSEDSSLFLNYTQAVQNQGYPEKALALLEKQKDIQSKPDYLKQIIAIAKGTDNPDLQQQYLKRLNAIDPSDINAIMQESEIFYSRGDFAAAYAVQDKVASRVGSANTEFWNSYGSVALLSGHYPSAIVAFKNLLLSNNINKSSVLQLVNLEQLGGNIPAAYHHAQLGYRKYEDISLVRSILDLGTDLGKWQELNRFTDSLSSKNMSLVQANPNSAVLVPLIRRHAGLPIEAYNEWVRIFQLWPNMTEVQKNYLWFLMDNNEIKQLKFIVKRWVDTFIAKPALWDVYSSALAAVGEKTLALKIMEQHQEQVNNSYSLLTGIADLFVDNNKPESAYYLSRRALYQLLNKVAPNPQSATPEQTLILIELMRAFAPAPMTYNAIVYLSKQLFVQSEVDEEILAWALEGEHYDLANYITNIHNTFHMYTKPWIQLTLALEHYDYDLMQLLLYDTPELLPYRDRVTAATLLEHHKVAEDYAYQGLSEHPQDHLMYELFTQTMLPRSNKVSVGGGQEAWGDVGGPFTRLSARYFVTPSVSVTAFGYAWFPHTNNTGIYNNVPSVNEIAGISARKYIHRGWVDASVAGRKSLGQVTPARLKWHRDDLFISRLNTDVRFGYHVLADETTALLLGGMKNDLEFYLEYNTDSYNYFDLQLNLDEFLGQDDSYLGTGQELRGHWQHKFYLSYPDWNINFYGSWLNYQYNSNQLVTPFLQQLIPPGQDPLVTYYMPISDVTEAVTIGVGQRYREEYTHDWKPFGEAGIVHSKVFSWGPTVSGGIATSVFGRDHLVLYGEYSVNQQQVTPLQDIQQQDSQTYYIIGIKYDYYF